jgi:hypothetical protein
MLPATWVFDRLARLSHCPRSATSKALLPMNLNFMCGWTRLLTRLRDVERGPDSEHYILTSNLDGGGTPRPDGDRVLRLSFVTP